MGFGWLWALNKRGEAFRLSANSSKDFDEEKEETLWRKTICDIPLKKISASIGCAWGIGANSQSYVFIYQSDCPCRVTEEVYENQRWYPINGYSSYLFPTDPQVWTDAAGKKAVQPDLHVLPSSGWEWEDPWTPDYNGRVTDKEGWMYATNFNRPYANWPFSTAFVRRRRWFRTRRYTGTEKWVQVAVPSCYELMDITIGGTDVPGQSAGFICVWMLAANGKILFRSGISRFTPEGEFWYEIDIPAEIEFNQISCSPSTGLLWAVSWEGRLFRRTGQANVDCIGVDWTEITCTPSDVRFLHVALGEQSVWAITIDGRAWFAKLNLDNPDEIICQNYWLDMTCSMSYLSIGPADQVFGVSLIDDVILYRSGVTEKELSGHTWQPIVAEVEVEKDEVSNNQIFETSCSDIGNMTVFEPPLHLTIPNGYKQLHSQSTPIVVKYRRSRSGNGTTKVPSYDTHKILKNDTAGVGGHDEVAQEVFGTEENDGEPHPQENNESESDTVSLPDRMAQQFIIEEGTEVWNDGDDTDSICSSTVARKRSSKRWSMISAGGCILFNSSLGAHGPPRTWFSNDSTSSHRIRPRKLNYTKAGWRKMILSELKQRNLAIWTAFNDFSLAFEQGTWTQCVAGHLWSMYHQRWCDVILNLTQSWRSKCIESDSNDCGLRIKFIGNKPARYKGKTGFIKLDDILCVRKESDTKSGKPLFLIVLFIKQIQSESDLQWHFPLKLACQSEEDQKSWLVAIDEAALKYQVPFELQMDYQNDIGNCVWAISHTGAVYIGKPGDRCLIKDQYWCCIGGHFKCVEASANGIIWAMGYDGRLWTYSHYSITSNKPQDDIQIDEVYENQRWSRLMMRYIPIPWLMSGAYYAWSDCTGRMNTPKESIKLPGSEWQWINDWKVDYSIDCDSDGWQYSKSFTRTFTSQKRFRYSAVRRRRWIRKRRIMTTPFRGGWKLVESGIQTNFTCITVQDGGESKKTFVFAVTQEGDLLCRLRVDLDHPDGTGWCHVLTPAPVTNVSIGPNLKLWVVCRHGLAYCCYAANEEELLTSGWCDVVPPKNCKGGLKQVVSGNYVVYALNRNGRVFSRFGVAPWCPEGEGWVEIESSTASVEHISLSNDNQLWALLKSSSPPGSVIARRYDTRGYGLLWDMDWWDMANVNGWIYVSANGYTSSLCDRRQSAVVHPEHVPYFETYPRETLSMTHIPSRI